MAVVKPCKPRWHQKLSANVPDEIEDQRKEGGVSLQYAGIQQEARKKTRMSTVANVRQKRDWGLGMVDGRVWEV